MVPRFLRPTFPDVGRILIQSPELSALVADRPMAGRVLNAGCGEGGYCTWLESRPGITRIDDIDVEITSGFTTLHPDPRHHLQIGSLTSLPYADASFDGALCTEVLEHIPDHATAAAELARVLKPGGVLIASVPLLAGPFDPNHVREGYTVESFSALLTAAGFAVEAHRTCCHAILRAVMHYWRAPLFRVGGNRTPYIPQALMSLFANADRVFRIGAPWDLVVRATRR